MTAQDSSFLNSPAAAPNLRMKIIRNSHHNVAMLLAEGMTNIQVAEATGYTKERVSMLSRAPAMQELIAKYREEIHESWREGRDNFFEDIRAAGRKAWRQINDHLDEADDREELLPINRLLAIADSSADRVGYHRKTATQNVNLNFAASLEAAIARSRSVIDAKPLED
jgi:hypothetical protein